MSSILATRGYIIDFATLAGRQQWLSNSPFISRLHIVGPAIPKEQEEESYERMSQWATDLICNWGAVFAAKKYLESSWPHVYPNLTQLVLDPATRPDFILADYLVDAVRDVCFENEVPFAMHWPQMPTGMMHASYIPGIPGLQVEVLTSEFATLWQRLKNAVRIYTALPHFLEYQRWVKQMRQLAGVSRQLPMLPRPNYLCLVNSFFALEAAKEIPPNVAAIGPVLADKVDELTEPFPSFLQSRSRVLYIALGTHVLFPHKVLADLLSGAITALRAGLIDGIIWAASPKARRQLDTSALLPSPTDSSDETTLGSLLENKHPSILTADFAPQRPVLHDPRVAVFISHAGASSTNEAVVAGIPVITLPAYFDQIQNAMRLRDAGFSVPLQKETLSASDVTAAITRILNDIRTDGPIMANVRRVCGIARIAAHRKHLAVDLIEEVLVDWQGRQLERRLGVKQPRGMHLETAEARMPRWKARNWDLFALMALPGLLVAAVVMARFF